MADTFAVHRLRDRPIELTDARGAKTAATLQVCPACKGERWFVYLVADRYAHLQCCECGTTYCQHEGPCGPDRGAHR